MDTKTDSKSALTGEKLVLTKKALDNVTGFCTGFFKYASNELITCCCSVVATVAGIATGVAAGTVGVGMYAILPSFVAESETTSTASEQATQDVYETEEVLSPSAPH